MLETEMNVRNAKKIFSNGWGKYEKGTSFITINHHGSNEMFPKNFNYCVNEETVTKDYNHTVNRTQNR